MSEVIKIVKTMPTATVHVLLWDDDVDSVFVNVKEKDLAKIAPPAVTGGTSISCVNRWITKHPAYCSNLSCVIFLTDLEVEYNPVFPKAPKLFCIPAKLYRDSIVKKFIKYGKIIKAGI